LTKTDTLIAVRHRRCSAHRLSWQGGELWQRYREGREDQLGALGLVVNVIVLWNTIDMDAAALDQLWADGFDVCAEDVARLSPLGFGGSA